ncbi:MAG: hypothetical protein ABJG68_06660 [Crocinitomicaceae bacterium]
MSDEKLVEPSEQMVQGPLSYLIIANLIWNACWLVGLAAPCFMLITEAGSAKGAFSGLIMFFLLIFAIFVLAIMAVHVMSIIALLKMRKGNFDIIKLYNVGSIAWVAICVLHAAQEPQYAFGSIPAAAVSVGLIIAMNLLVKKENLKNKVEI